MRHLYHSRFNLFDGISIHAPREGCDGEPVELVEAHLAISIHAPREGCDGHLLDVHAQIEFQSTHPVRGATIAWYRIKMYLIISIHAPREGCDRSRVRR